MDVRGEYTIRSVGQGPEEGTLVVDGDAGTNTSVRITITRAEPFTGEAPFMARVNDAERSRSLTFTGSNRFTGGGITGHFHSVVTASSSSEAQPGPAGEDATVTHDLNLEFEDQSVEMVGGFNLTFKESRANVVTEGFSDHVEGRTFAIKAARAEPLANVKSAECQAAIDRFNDVTD
ncbi:MAG: hypothetical protein Q8O67_00265 [Deltaproteobacteria bacterium]|nr:hypothetical protein [Deltaproteobacteria bacterium]